MWGKGILQHGRVAFYNPTQIFLPYQITCWPYPIYSWLQLLQFVRPTNFRIVDNAHCCNQICTKTQKWSIHQLLPLELLRWIFFPLEKYPHVSRPEINPSKLLTWLLWIKSGIFYTINLYSHETQLFFSSVLSWFFPVLFLCGFYNYFFKYFLVYLYIREYTHIHM